MRNIVLIGFMGTGKSAVGQILARRLGWTFVDTDRRVEVKERATVAGDVMDTKLSRRAVQKPLYARERDSVQRVRF